MMYEYKFNEIMILIFRLRFELITVKFNLWFCDEITIWLNDLSQANKKMKERRKKIKI